MPTDPPTRREWLEPSKGEDGGAGASRPLAFTFALRLGNRDVTRNGHSQEMRRLAVLLASLSLLAFAGVAAGGRGAPPQIPRIPGTWSHAEINVRIKRQPHTLILDRGRVLQVTTSQITLREGAGGDKVIQVGAGTLVTLDGRRASVTDLRRRMFATTMQIDGGDAVRVRATSF